MNTKKILSSFLMAAGALAIIATGALWNNFNKVEATNTPVPLGSVKVTGYAWSDNIGWIQFYPDLDGFGGVFYNTSTGQLSGYAWSDNIGWIKFDGLSSYLGSSPWVAKADTSSGLVSGWARACAGTVNGDCTSMTSRTDGWDGWIKFDTGKSNSVKIDLTDSDARGEFHGYAWGSDVVGWISFNCKEGAFDFSGNIKNICGTSNYQVETAIPLSSSFTFSLFSGALSATTTAGLSATSTVATLSLNGQTAGEVLLSASAITGALTGVLTGAKAQFSKDNGVTWSDILTVGKLTDTSASVKVRVIKIPGTTLKGSYTVSLTAKDQGLGGLEKPLNITLNVNKVTYRWE